MYAKHIEPHRLEINQVPVRKHGLPKGLSGLKIVQFSDTHIGFQYGLKELEKHIQTINDLQPDIICFTGDLLDEPHTFSTPDLIVPILQQLNAPFGKFAVYGNHDHGGNGTRLYKSIMEKSGFQVLLNTNKRISLPDGSLLYIAGIDDAMLGRPDISASMKEIPDHAFTIILSHAPDLADSISGQSTASMQLSGHSHGGQVQLPWLGPLITPPYGSKYLEGSYQVSANHPLELYVNRGLGTTRMPLRFGSIPEITLFTLQGENT